VRAAYFVAQAVAQGLVAAGKGGVIVNVSSQMGVVGGRDRTVYCGTKHAVEGMTKAMALELAPHGIRVVTVAPTFVETALAAKAFADPVTRADILARIPMGRPATVEEVAASVVYLCSPAAGMVTGTHLDTSGIADLRRALGDRWAYESHDCGSEPRRSRLVGALEASRSGFRLRRARLACRASTSASCCRPCWPA
jgi:NAD(P)-dependent dehydrogenase (short-subunit alcohol dehydrogenase family)